MSFENPSTDTPEIPPESGEYVPNIKEAPESLEVMKSKLANLKRVAEMQKDSSVLVSPEIYRLEDKIAKAEAGDEALATEKPKYPEGSMMARLAAKKEQKEKGDELQEAA